MALVRVLVVTHLAFTAALLLVFAGLVLCQRLFAAARPGAAATPLPASVADPYPTEPVLLPAQETAARRQLPDAAPSVLQWTLDLRTPASPAGRPSDVALSGSS